MEIKEYLRLARHWAWLLGLGLLLGLVGAYLATLYQTPMYEADTKMLIMRAPDVSSTDLSYLTDQQLVQTYIQMLTTRPVLDEAASQLGYIVDEKQVQVQQVRDTPMISLTIQDPNSERAAAIANTLVTVLISQNESLQSSRYSSSENSLQAQATQVEDQINSLQGQIDEISTQSVQLQTTQVESEIEKLKTEIAQAESDIQSMGGTGSSTVPSSVLTDKEAQLSQLKSMLTLYQQIYTNLVVAGKPSESGTVDRLTRLQKTLDLYQQIYLQLLKSLEDIRLARLQNSSNVVQIEAAVAPTRPVSPRPLVNMGLGAVVGLFLAAGIVFLIEYMSDTLGTPTEVTSVLGLPIIGYVAELKRFPSPGEIYVSKHPRSPVAEAFRSLRANLEFADKEQPLKTILVTSSRSGEGKTTIATNLAAIFAQAGKKVILLDADLRRPSIHHVTGVQNRTGLSTMFKAPLSVQDVWKQRHNSRNFHIITSGSMPPNPAELLGSEKMLLIMAELRQAADVVVIDSPPSVVADSQLLASMVDGVLLVLQPGKSPTDEALATLEQMKRAGARMLGVVFNRIPRNRSQYYGGYRYYSSSPYHENSEEDQVEDTAVQSPSSAIETGRAQPVEHSNGRSKPASDLIDSR